MELDRYHWSLAIVDIYKKKDFLANIVKRSHILVKLYVPFLSFLEFKMFLDHTYPNVV